MNNHIEEFKFIKGYNKKYYITNFGRVFIVNYRGTGRVKEMKPRLIQGYKSLGLEGVNSTTNNRKQKIHKIHRLVAEHFVENIENKPCVNHKDGDKLNNHFSNLEWATVRENTVHAYANRLSKNWWTKELGEVCINLIDNYGYNFADVRRLFGISKGSIASFWRIGYKTFKLIHSNRIIPKHSKPRQVSESYLNYINKLLKDNSVLN